MKTYKVVVDFNGIEEVAIAELEAKSLEEARSQAQALVEFSIYQIDEEGDIVDEEEERTATFRLCEQYGCGLPVVDEESEFCEKH